MNRLPVFVVLLLIAAGPAFADTVGGSLALGGAGQSAEGTRITVWRADSLAAGIGTPAPNLIGPLRGGMQLGGFLAWQGGDFRLDASLAPGDPGTSYSLRIGADRPGDRFTVNPVTGLGLADVARPGSDVNLTVTVNRALTPSLSIVGTAEARRNMGPVQDGTGQGGFLFGAGLGYRF
jgi:hypothetical protein